MSAKRVVLVVMSCEDGYAMLVKELRRRNKDARLIAVVLPGHEASSISREAADEIWEMRAYSNRLQEAVEFRRLAAKIRNEQIDELILQFESIKLRVLAVFSRPRVCNVWLRNLQIVSLSPSLCATLLELFRLRVSGYIKLMAALVCCYLVPIRSRVKR